MKKILLFVTILIFSLNLHAEEKKAYFAGGCFWCMEESFDQIEGVLSSISGYSGGHLKNPTYQDVIYKDTGHVEAIEITYDSKIVSYEKLLNIENIYLIINYFIQAIYIYYIFCRFSNSFKTSSCISI